MNIKLNDSTVLTPIMVTGEHRRVQGKDRDTLCFVFAATEDMAALDSLPETGWSGQHPDRQKTPGRFA